MLLSIVAIVFPLFAIVFFGWLYGRKKQPDMAFANQLNMEVFVPALVFAAMADKSFDLAANWGLAVGAVVGVVGSGLAGWGLARLLGPELTAGGRRRWLWYLRLPAAVRLAVRLGRMVMYQGLRRSLRQVAERLGRRRR